MTAQSNTQAQNEQKIQTIEDLQHPFAGLCFAYGSIFSDALSNGDLVYRLRWLIDDADKIKNIAQALSSNILEDATKPQA